MQEDDARLAIAPLVDEAETGRRCECIAPAHFRHDQCIGGDPAAPVEDVAAMLTYKVMAGANLFVLKVADQTLGSLLDIRA